MAYQSVFRRYELKYLLTPQQKERVLAEMAPYMAMDQYGRTTIRNLYFDTNNYRLIRHSIEKPVFKEKLRIRSYQKATEDDDVFIELKRKYESLVYKRRVSMPLKDSLRWICDGEMNQKGTQITDEIAYFMKHYESLRPTVFLSYEREAYFEKNGGDLRITFDENILARQEQLSLVSDPWGTPLLPDNRILMEIKCSGGIPLWMTAFLSSEHIYKTSFSKYGTAYINIVYPKLLEELHHDRNTV